LLNIESVHVVTLVILFLWGFKNERHFAKAYVVQEICKSRFANKSLADVIVAIDAAAEFALRVVSVNAADLCQSDGTVELVDH